MLIRLAARIVFGICLIGLLRPASAQTYPDCKIENIVSFVIPRGTAKVHFSYHIPTSVPVRATDFSSTEQKIATPISVARASITT